MPPDASSTQIQLTSTICTAFAVAVTLLRLYIRRRNHWVDDYCAMFSMAVLTTQMGVILKSRGQINSFKRSYLVMTMFYITIWSARIAILFTIIRVGGSRTQKHLLSAVVIIFMLLWAVLTGQLFWTCEMQRRHSTSPISSCTPSRQMAILQITAGAFADLTLLVSSLQLFRVIQDSSLRHRLKFIFSTCMATTVASIVHVSFIFNGQGNTMELIAALVESCVSLTVSSLPVVTNVFFKLNPSLFHQGSAPSALRGSHSQTAFLGSLSFAPSPADALSTFYEDEEAETPCPAKARLIDGPRTASDLERFSIAELPRIRTDGLSDPGYGPLRPPEVHIHSSHSPSMSEAGEWQY